MKKLLSLIVILTVAMLQLQAQIVISEIMYNPPESGTDSLEFVEFYNNSASSVDMTGYIVSGVTYTFPSVSIAAGEYFVIAVDSQKLINFYGVPCNGDFSGGLSNNGEAITLKDGSGILIDSVLYDDAAPWVTTPDGNGPSLELCDANSDNNDGNNWSASANFVGIVNSKTVYASPGAPNCIGTVSPVVSFSSPSIIVNEQSGSVSFSVSITNADSNIISVDIHINNVASTAINPEDYIFADTSISFPTSVDTGFSFTVQITDDAIFEPTDTLILTLQNLSSGAMMGDSTLKIIILDDDATVDYGDCLNLFISEYIEGSSYNKALEIYNPTNQAIDLSNYSLQRFSNADTTASATLNLNGTIPVGDVFVLMNTNVDTAYIGLADLTTTFLNHNGNDAYVLFNYTDTIDIFGIIGGTANFDIDTLISGAKDHSLVRKIDIHKGSLNWATGNMEWDIYATDDFSHIGSHTMNPCQVSIPTQTNTTKWKIYPNPFDREITCEGQLISRIQILDITGKIIYDNNQINAHHFVIKDACFQKGMYFIKAFDNQGNILTQKIIKK